MLPTLSLLVCQSLTATATPFAPLLARVRHDRYEYQHKMLDYMKLADTLTMEQELFRSIATRERIDRAFYRVAFYGKSFPSSIRSKEFVYRSAPC